MCTGKLLACYLIVFGSLTYERSMFCERMPEQKCLAMTIRLDGVQLQNPRTIELRSKGKPTTTLRTKNECLNVPSKFSSNTVDVAFNVLNNRIYISGVDYAYLKYKYDWEIVLADKTFVEDWDYLNIPTTEVAHTCIVIFHAGDPEPMMIQTNCRNSPVVSSKPVAKGL
jgi:hypothetical protein